MTVLVHVPCLCQFIVQNHPACMHFIVVFDGNSNFLCHLNKSHTVGLLLYIYHSYTKHSSKNVHLDDYLPVSM